VLGDAGPGEVDEPTTVACLVDVTWTGALAGETASSTVTACLGLGQPLAFDCGFYMSALEVPGLTFGTPSASGSCDLPQLLVPDFTWRRVCRGSGWSIREIEK
jgi:hypothetical protein